MNNSIQDALTKTGKALTAFEIMAQEPMQVHRGNVDATIQRFEFTIELFWKLLKRILLVLGREVLYPRDILKEAYAGKLIDNENVWLKMLNDRNQTAHTYDEQLADKIYTNIKDYCPILRQTYNQLFERFEHFEQK
jgi:nucleotidyltransferase substrate binding protein (TIGR01987 family)